MTPAIQQDLERLAADARSGASELLPRAVAVLQRARAEDPTDVPAVARAVAHAQPAMAPLWNAALAALGEEGDPGALDRFEQRWRRAGDALVREAGPVLARADGAAPLVATWSFSRTVLGCLVGFGRRQALTVACAEGRPACEGRRLALELAGAGIAVEFFTDGGLSGVFDRPGRTPDAVLVGADAVAPEWIINKCGTRMLAAAAAAAGVPVYVAATRDKFVDTPVAALLRVESRDPAEVWGGAPAGVSVRNAYFERVPLALVSGVITDVGLLGGDMVAEACRAASARVPPGAIEWLG
jgi:translation initiation factor 2B subunit (eIF-2B alpha/beta/delta family)